MSMMRAAKGRTDRNKWPSREALSFREAVVLADVVEKERAIRKDIENATLPSDYFSYARNVRLALPWESVVMLKAAYSSDLFGKEMRAAVIIGVSDVVTNFTDLWRASLAAPSCLDASLPGGTLWSAVASEKDFGAVFLDPYVKIDIQKLCADVYPRLSLYACGLHRVTEKDDVLGGAAVFDGTRLSVLHIGEMYERGETLSDILEDYPDLTAADVEFARLYFLAHPTIGRPRTRVEAADDKISP